MDLNRGREAYVSVFSKIWEKLQDKAYREAFVASQLKRGLPTQLRVMLKDRHWTQGDLAQRSGLKQGAISRASDPDYGNLTINTILKIASGFDVAYVGRFVPFSDLARWYSDLSESALSVSSFSDESGFIQPRYPQVSVASESARSSLYSSAVMSKTDDPRLTDLTTNRVGGGMTLMRFQQTARCNAAGGIPKREPMVERTPLAPNRRGSVAENSTATGITPSLVPRSSASVISIKSGTARYRKGTITKSSGGRLRHA